MAHREFKYHCKKCRHDWRCSWSDGAAHRKDKFRDCCPVCCGPEAYEPIEEIKP